MSIDFAHDVALEWAKAHANDFLTPAEFGLKAAQVYLAADMAFAGDSSGVARFIERLTALSIPSETLQSHLRSVSQCPGSPDHVPEKQADAEGSA